MIWFRKRNEGAALILVICTVSLLSVLGSFLLVKTTNNRKMKEAEKKAQTTFNAAGDSSKEMASALEIIAQEALKSAFSDLMLEYGSVSGEEGTTARIDRFNDIFVACLKKKIEQPEAARAILKDALGLGDSDELAVSVTFGGVDFDADVRMAGATTSEKVTIKNVQFVYNDGNGSASSITTDISITAKIPDVSKAMAPEAEAAYEDFVLITDGGVTNTMNAVKTLTGNVYVAKDFIQRTGTTNFKNAAKLLIKGSLDLSQSATVTIDNGDRTADNVLYHSGKGLWAGNISIDRANLDVKANCYIKDDLTVAVTEPVAGDGTAASVEFSGKEYVGYAGGSERSAGKNSAIMINTVKGKMVLDFSGMDALMLKGNSYIRDEKWNSGADTNNNDLVGILQGESVAYKEMQAMYLVPASCSPTGKNPMTDTEYDLSSKTISFNFSEAGLDLADYLDAANPFVTRFIRLDGGKTRYVYLYLNFASEAKANAYFRDYMESSKGEAMKKYLDRLGNYGSKITLAAKNYTVSNLVSYNTAADVSYANMSAGEQYKLMITCLDAAQWYGGLFYNLDTEVTKTDAELSDHDMIRTMIVRPAALAGASTSIAVDGKKFIFHKGDAATSANSWSGQTGILLVDGDLTINSSFTFTGLILVTGEVKMEANNVTLTADVDAVRTLLENEEVAKFFRGKGGSGSNGGDGSYISGDSITIEFENWQRN